MLLTANHEPFQISLLLNMKLMSTHLLMLGLVMMSMVMVSERSFARAEEDELEEEDEGVVEEEETGDAGDDAGAGAEEDEGKKTTSADADTTILFTKPVGTSNLGKIRKRGRIIVNKRSCSGAGQGPLHYSPLISSIHFYLELPAGQIAEFLVGFTNKGDQEMVVDSLEASLRYPMDFTFHLQNFSALNYVKTVKSKQQATVAYSFIPADAFAGRPIGLTVNLHYRDAAGNFFIDPVFNETVQIVEFDEGFDTETFFMYVCIFGLAVLCLFLGFNYLSGKPNFL